MARTKDIPKLVARHHDEINRLYERSFDVRDDDTGERAWMAENLLFRAAVEWEVLSSTWLVAAFNNNGLAVKQHITARIRQKIRDAYRPLADSPHLDLRFNTSATLNVATIEAIFTQDGKNLAFWKPEHLKSHRPLLPMRLTPESMGINTNDWLVLGVVNSGRNVVAHRSQSSVKNFNEALRECGHSQSSNIRKLSPKSRSVSASLVGSYLQATPQGARSSRIQIVLQSLLRVAAKLDPS